MFCEIIYGQSLSKKDSLTIEFNNPSLEGEKGSSMLPLSWYIFKSEANLLPDIQPDTFGVKLPPIRGKTYFSLI
jgi:hypothetical protein